MSETFVETPASENATQAGTLPRSQANEHIKAARCYEMAAALHHEAARFEADGDYENAEECAKQAVEHASRAMQAAQRSLGRRRH